jgi:DHA1 family bicyclomycin/chloramphenicol resistance-like MFS transporter
VAGEVQQEEPSGIALPMLVVLGALSAIPPLSFDMYLPALPQIAGDLGVAESGIHLTLSACLIGLALGQLFGGPISDALGRRRPLLAGVVGYAACSVGCAVAPGVTALVAARFLQGLFGGVAVVISRAVVRDRSTDAEAARIFSLLILVAGAAPVLAPVFGGFLIGLTSWRGVFATLAVLGVAGLVAVLGVLPETLPPGHRRTGGVHDTLAVARRVARDRVFAGYALTGACGFGALFFFISSSSFVFQDVYGLTPRQFSAVFAGSAVGLVTMGRLNAALVRRIEPAVMLRWGIAQILTGGVLLCLVLWLGLGTAAVIAAVYVANWGFPFVAPNATALALVPYGREAGSVSAYLGVLQFAAGAAGGPLAGLAGDTTEFSMAFGIVVMAALALLAHAAFVRHDRPVAGPVAEEPRSTMEPRATTASDRAVARGRLDR